MLTTFRQSLTRRSTTDQSASNLFLMTRYLVQAVVPIVSNIKIT